MEHLVQIVPIFVISIPLSQNGGLHGFDIFSGTHTHLIEERYRVLPRSHEPIDSAVQQYNKVAY